MGRLILIVLSFLATAPTLAAEQQTPLPFETMIEQHRDEFRWIDLSDMRAIRASVRAAKADADGCPRQTCPDFNCTTAADSLSQTAELFMRMTVLENALDHMRVLEVEHLRSLHREALIEEAIAEYQTETLFWQGATITLGATLAQSALVAGDMQSLFTARDPIRITSAIDELLRDTLALAQDLDSFRTNSSPRFRQNTDDLTQTITTLTDLKSNSENLVNAALAYREGNSGAVSQELMIGLARNARSAALDFLARRQDEVARLNADAARERAEANAFAVRLRGLSLQKELAGQIAEEVFELYLALTSCVQASCSGATMEFPSAPELFRPLDGTEANTQPRLNMRAVQQNAGRILELGLYVRPDWLGTDCDQAENQAQARSQSAASPLTSTNNAVRQGCRMMENAGICSLLTPERQAECRAGASIAVEACTAVPSASMSLQSAQTMSAEFNTALSNICRLECDLGYGVDFHLDAQRLLAIDQVRELDAQHFARGGLSNLDPTNTDTSDASTLEDQIRDLRRTAAARSVRIGYVPATNTYIEYTTPSADINPVATLPGQLTSSEQEQLELLQSELSTIRAAAPVTSDQVRTAWGLQAREFWAQYGSHQFLTCGGQELEARRNQCYANCASTLAANYQECAVPAPEQNFDFGPVLYPPDDPRGADIEAYNAQDLLRAAQQE